VNYLNPRRPLVRPLLLVLCLAQCFGVLAQPLPSTASAVRAEGHGYAEALKATAARKSTPRAPFEPVRNSATDSQTTELEMYVGESRVFAAPGVSRIAVGNGSLMSAAALDGKEVILFANGVGTSSLFIWNADGRYQRVKINIVPGDTARHARDIASFLSTIPQAKASIVGTHVVVEGDELSDADLRKIDLLAEKYPQIINATNRVGWEQMVAIDVKVVEFPTSVLKEAGLKWNSTGGAAIGAIWSPVRRGNDGPYEIDVQSQAKPPIGSPAGGAVLLPRGLNILSAVNMGLNAQLSLLAQDGKATLLAEPQLSARSGTKASFVAGGSIPYATVSQNGARVELQTYGVKLDIKPQVDRRGVIRAEIMTEVSSIDRSLSTPVGPALLMRSTKTEFNVRDGETIVLSGLLQRESSTDIDKVPVLGDIPVLGALFRSKRFLNKETELVIFVTPRVVNADSAWMKDRVQRTTERLEERLGPTPHLGDPLQPGMNYQQLDAAPSPHAQTQQVEVAVEPAKPDTLAYSIPRASQGALLRIKSGSALLREAPGASARVVMRIAQEGLVHLSGRQAVEAPDGRYLAVRVGEVEAWVLGEQLEPVKVDAAPLRQAVPDGRALAEVAGLKPLLPGRLEGAVPAKRAFRVQTAGVALHAFADAQSSVQLKLPQGALVWALPHEPRGPWLPVQYGTGSQSRQGWVLGQSLLPLEARPEGQ
jgi:pilus assembly protein CpaC